jgi:hypothetical protein
MSTALIGGIALQGTPPDYANLAARQKRQESVDEARRSKDSKAAMEGIVKGLNHNTHPAIWDSTDAYLQEKFNNAIGHIESGKYNELNRDLFEAQNYIKYQRDASKTLYEIEAGANNFVVPEGIAYLLRSKEFKIDPEKAMEGFFNQEGNEVYRDIINFQRNPNGTTMVGWNRVPRYKDGPDAELKRILARHKDAVGSEFGRVVEQEKSRLGGMVTEERIRTLQEDFAYNLLTRIMEENPAMRVNMAISGINVENEDEVRSFAIQNSPFVTDTKSYTPRATGGGRGATISNPIEVEIQVPGMVNNQEVFVDTKGITFQQQSNISMNTSNSVWVGERGQYKQYGRVGSSSKQAVTTNSIVQMPVYTGTTKVIDIGGGRKLTLEKWMPFDSKYYQQAGGNVVNRLFLYGDISDAESGPKKDTVLIPLTDENMGVLNQQRGGNWATPEYFKKQFPDATPWGTKSSASSPSSATPPSSSTPSADNRRTGIESTGLKKIK